MPLVAAKCTQCGANIEIDDSKEAGICKYCGTAFITEKAINNYKINAEKVIVNSENVNISNYDIESALVAAEKLIKRELYYDAKKMIKEIIKNCPYDYRGWWQMALLEYNQEGQWFDDNEDYQKALALTDNSEIVKEFRDKEYDRICKEGKNIIEFCKNPDLSKLDNIYVNRYKMQYENNNLALYEYEFDSIFGSGYKKIFLTYMSSIKYEIEKGKLVGIITFEYDARSFSDLHNIYIIGVTDNKILIENDITSQNIIDEYNAKRRIGCYIATCVYGSYDCPQVWTLRRYRDYILAKSWYGRVFIKSYYIISPALVKWFGKTKWFKSFWKSKLDRMVADLNRKGIDDTYYCDKY